MRTVRRLYFYAVAFISLEVVLWGLIGLLRFIFDTLIWNDTATLAQALALVLVGVPIFLFHWLWTQRAANRDEEEQTATLRAVFLYAVLLSTLIPLVQNVLALIDRTFIVGVHIPAGRALLGGGQTWVDNLIAMVLNGVVAAYFWQVLGADWRRLPERESFIDVRRLYRYIWMLYSLVMVVFGTQQTLRFLFYAPVDILGGGVGREILVNGVALLAVGTPIWAYSWKVCQDALAETVEQFSNLRLGVLYLLSLAGVITVLATMGVALSVLLRLILGEPLAWNQFVNQIGGPLSLGVPMALVWAYFGHWLGRQIDSTPDVPRRAGMRRLYRYIQSVIGLGAAFVGTSLLFSFVIDVLTGTNTLWGESLRPRLAGSLATLLVGLPLWLATWRPVQSEALLAGDMGDHVRRSVVRKAYLYFVLFASVIGGMVAAAILIFQLLNAALSRNVPTDFLSTVLNAFQLLVLFVFLLVYHLRVLRTDGRFATNELVSRYADFPVLVLDSAEGNFGAQVASVLRKQIPGLPVTVFPVGETLPTDSFKAVVLSSSLALDAPGKLGGWLHQFNGNRLVVPVETPGWLWLGGSIRPLSASIKGTAQAIRQIAEGQEVRPSSGTSAWTVVVYVLAALFGLQVLTALLVTVISLFISS
jgi:hypothetical protein